MLAIIIDLISIIFKLSVVLYVLHVFELIKINKSTDPTIVANQTETTKPNFMDMFSNMMQQLNTNMNQNGLQIKKEK